MSLSLQALRPQGAEGAVVLPHRPVPALRALRRAGRPLKGRLSASSAARSEATKSRSAAGPFLGDLDRAGADDDAVRERRRRGACSGVEMPKPA